MSKLPSTSQSQALVKIRDRMLERRKLMQSEGVSTQGSTTVRLVYLLIDSSGSMAGSKLVQAREGAINFAKDALRKKYSVGLISFNSSAQVMAEPSTQIERFMTATGCLSDGGSTNMAAAICLATSRFQHIRATRTIVLFTDGMPDDQTLALVEAEAAKNQGIDIIAIGTKDADKAFLGRLASRNDLVVSATSARIGEAIIKAAGLLPAPGLSR